jgi:hypothetical protein
MPELVTIPISFFEITVDYQKPHLRLLADRGALVQGIFDSLEPWNPRVDDIELRTSGKLSEQGVAFKVPSKRITFFIGPASCTFTQDAVDWPSAEETILILSALLSKLAQFTDVVLGTKHTTVAVHLQPRTLHFAEMLRPFFPSQFASLETTPLKTLAIVGKWENRKVTIDGSASLANGIFLRFERDFYEAVTLEEMAFQLKKDEQELFAIMGVEEDAG